MPIHHKAEQATHEMHGARFTTLASPSRDSTTTSIWRVDLTPGTAGTPHEVTAQEVLYVCAGHARVRLANEETEVGPGDCVIVPPDTPFVLEAVGTSDFSAICCFPAGSRARLADGREFTPPWAQ